MSSRSFEVDTSEGHSLTVSVTVRDLPRNYIKALMRIDFEGPFFFYSIKLSLAIFQEGGSPPPPPTVMTSMGQFQFEKANPASRMSRNMIPTKDEGFCQFFFHNYTYMKQGLRPGLGALNSSSSTYVYTIDELLKLLMKFEYKYKDVSLSLLEEMCVLSVLYRT